MNDAWIDLDGSMGEGGGQILRSSLTLSLLTGRPFRLHNIRARRPKPGLQPQHLMSVRAAATISNATVLGDSKGSSELSFEPGEIAIRGYHFAIGTAGATGLVLQTILLPLALKGRAPSHVTITGGTHVKASPSFHFLNTTWRAYLAKMGIHADLQMLRPGFYPRGGGIIEAEIQPCDRVQPLQLMSVGTDGAIEVTGFSAVAGLPESIAERQVRQAEMRLRSQRIQTSLAIEIWPGGPGTVIGLELQTPPAPSLFVAIGERGKPAERVADQAVNEMLAHLAADPYAVEAHSADQIVLPLALAEGPSAYRVSVVTQHLLTNIAVIQRFLDRKISCAGAEGEAGVVRID